MTQAERREVRRAALLRENLRRRKARVRSADEKREEISEEKREE